MTGFVSLVGAGPGDPDLLTRRAARRLAEADLVLYDALVSPEALDLAPRARRFPVGKRAGRPSVAQATIHRLMIRSARRGERVVRLKCGDPFVLGRGGEEALALAAARVPFEIVPGLTTAVAAPELAGIPVTHRGVASGFAVVSGHAEEAYRPIVEGLPPGAVTLVVLMGLGSRAALARLLVARGWATATPVAVCLGAGTRRARTWIGTLGGLETAAVEEDAPGTIVVGSVVSVGEAIAAAISAEEHVPARANRPSAAASLAPNAREHREPAARRAV